MTIFLFGYNAPTMGGRMGFFSPLKKKWISIVCLLLSGCGSSVLYNALDESEVNQMIAILKQYGISATKLIGKESCSISVNQDDFSTAIDLLESQGYPLPKYQTIGEVFKKSGLVSSPLEERVRFMNALSESIAMTLSKIPGVLKARVHIVLPDNDPYAEKTLPSSAAVFITYRQDSLVEDYIREIKFLVTNSIEGLDYDKVSVALFPITLPPLPKLNKPSDAIVTIAGIDLVEATSERFYLLMGILSTVIVILLVIIGTMVWSSKKTKKVKQAKIENLADAEETDTQPVKGEGDPETASADAENTENPAVENEQQQ